MRRCIWDSLFEGIRAACSSLLPVVANEKLLTSLVWALIAYLPCFSSPLLPHGGSQGLPYGDRRTFVGYTIKISIVSVSSQIQRLNSLIHDQSVEIKLLNHSAAGYITYGRLPAKHGKATGQSRRDVNPSEGETLARFFEVQR